MMSKLLSHTLLRLIVWATIIILVMILGYYLLPSRYQPLAILPELYKHNFLLWSWANFDGEHYLSIAQNGYQTIRGQSEYAFFPLFPLLIKVVGTLLLGDYYLASHLIVSISLISFVYLLIKHNPFSLKDPWSLIWPVLIFPGAIFLVSIYSESLFLLWASLVFIFVKKKNWGLAMVATALSTATRINGLSLVLFLGYSLWQNRVRLSSSLSYLALSLSGLFGYMLYLWATTSSALSFFTAQSGWGKSTLTMPWETATRYFRALTTDFSPDLMHLVVAVEVVVTIYLLTLLMVAVARRALSLPYLVYCAFNLALPLATGSLGSIPRFGLLLFPLFVVTASLKPPFRAILYLISALLATVGIILFTRGYWWA